MPEIFSSDPGTVVLAKTSSATALNLEVTNLLKYGDLDLSLVDNDPNHDDTFRSVVTGIAHQGQGGLQFLHSLREFIYIYSFGERIDDLALSGIAFYQQCRPRQIFDNNPVVADGDTGHGIESIINYYKSNRATSRATPLTLKLGHNTFLGFLKSYKFDLSDPEKVVASYLMTFAAILT